MRKTTKATLVVLTVGLSLAAGSGLYAQSTQVPNNEPTDRDGSRAGSSMMGDDMRSMMTQMRQMMNTCNKMMAGMHNQSPAPAEPAPNR